MSKDAWAFVRAESLLTPVEEICTIAIIWEAQESNGLE